MLDKSSSKDLKNTLTEIAQELVLEAATSMDEAAKGGIRKSVNAQGKVKKRHFAKSAGQAQANSKHSAGQRRRSAIKQLKTKIKKFGKAIGNKAAKKIRRAKTKRTHLNLKKAVGRFHNRGTK